MMTAFLPECLLPAHPILPVHSSSHGGKRRKEEEEEEAKAKEEEKEGGVNITVRV